MRSQLDELRKEKESLEAENAPLQESDTTLQAELDHVLEENRRLQEERLTEEAAGEAADETAGGERNEAKTLLEEQRQLYENLQAELAEAVKRSNNLEDRCCSLEDQLVKVMEELKLERLKAVDAVRSKYEDRFLQQVQELQRQMQELQDCRKVKASGKNGNHKQPLTKETTKPGSADLGVSTDKSTTTNIDKPANADSNSSTCGETAEATKESSDNQSKELAVALMAPQLPPLSKFQDWIAQFELVAGVYKWSPQAKLIHLTARLRGEAFTFYRSCSKQQKASYDLLVKELTRRFTPV